MSRYVEILETIQELELPQDVTASIFSKLKYYKTVNSDRDLCIGGYIRFISLTDPNDIYLSNVMVVLDHKHLSIICRSFSKKIFTINLSTHIVFQKLPTKTQK